MAALFMRGNSRRSVGEVLGLLLQVFAKLLQEVERVVDCVFGLYTEPGSDIEDGQEGIGEVRKSASDRLWRFTGAEECQAFFEDERKRRVVQDEPPPVCRVTG